MSTAQTDAKMGYQPGLDGLRAVSIVAVLIYHAGFDWLHGGFLGVEVFFVVSGYLITSLMLEEHERSGTVALRKFWIRRIRRLVPALMTVLMAVGIWAAIWGNEFDRSQLRRDFPWAIFYSANWGQIYSKFEYFSGTPTMLRHLWSLSVEEQWYIIWPLAMIALLKLGGSLKRRGALVIAMSISVMASTAIAASVDWPARFPNILHWRLESVDTHNFLYLSTFSRSSGLLLGAGLAFLWRPWRRDPAELGSSRFNSVVGYVAMLCLLVMFWLGEVSNASTYYWVLPSVSVLSALLLVVVTHPHSSRIMSVLKSKPVVLIGQRSYGLYLWSWPISHVCDAYQGSVLRFLLAMAITIPISELSFRFVETPIRAGLPGNAWKSRRTKFMFCTLPIGAVSVVLFGYFASAPAKFDFFKDSRSDVNYIAPQVPTVALPRNLVIVGDSTGRALFNNLPAGIGKTFKIGDGTMLGCSVYTDGDIITARDEYSYSFDRCSGWTATWAYGAVRARASVALVVLGGWEVFDQEVNGELVKFGSTNADQRFLDGLQSGIDALSDGGVHAALLEVACMRPKDVDPAGVKALPERGMDDRVQHINDLLRLVASNNRGKATFIEGPSEYCEDPTIASDSTYRWDGVHAYKMGANLTFMTITKALLAIPSP